MPITMFLLDFFEKYGLTDPDKNDEFKYEHWCFFLQWLRERVDHGIHPLTKDDAEYINPFAYSKAQLEKFKLEEKKRPELAKYTFDYALSILEEVKEKVKDDQKEMEKWRNAFHSTFG